MGLAADQLGSSPVFDTVQELLDELAGKIGAEFDPATNQIIFDLTLDEQFLPELQDVPLAFDLDLSPVADIETSATVSRDPAGVGSAAVRRGIGSARC